MPARKPKPNKRTRDTHDPETVLPPKLLNELPASPDEASQSHPAPKTKSSLTHSSRKQERKRKRKQKKASAVQARVEWNEKRSSIALNTRSSTAVHASPAPTNERKRSLPNPHSASPTKRLRSRVIYDHPEITPKRKQSVDKNAKRSKTIPILPTQQIQDTSDHPSVEEDPDKVQIERLEKLLGIPRRRKLNKARGEKFNYSQVFKEGEDDLIDLIGACDATLDRLHRPDNLHPEKRLQKEESNDSDAPSEESIRVKSEHIKSSRARKEGDDVATHDVNDFDHDSAPPSSDNEDGEASLDDNSTSRGGSEEESNQSNLDAVANSDYDSQLGSQHGTNYELLDTVVQSKHSSYAQDQNSDESKETNRVAKYKPPSARDRAKNSAEGVKRRLRGLLNRVADANASGVAHDIATIFKSRDHNFSQRELSRLYSNSALDSVRDGSGVGYFNPYVRSHAAIATHLGVEVDGVVLATFLVSAIGRITIALEQSRDEKDSRTQILINQEQSGDDVFGYVALVCALYERKAISCRIIYDLVRVIADPLTQTRLEILLVLLRRAGPLLRTDDPVSLKDMIEFVHSQAGTISKSTSDTSSTKLQVILDLITDIKNNKVKKSAIRGQDAKFAWASTPDAPLSASIAELLDEEFTTLRWWDQSNGFLHKKKGVLSESNQNRGGMGKGAIENESRDLVTLAHSLRLNTEYRKALFTTIMSSISVSNAYGKLEMMGGFDAKKNHDRDTALVILHCCAAENVFNPFYSHLGEKMCARSRRCRFTFEFALCDIFRALPGSEKSSPLSKRKARNYYQMLAQLWANNALSLCMLRRFPDLQECGEHEQKFLKGALETLFNEYGDSDQILQAFTKLGTESWSGAKAFRLSLVGFLRRHVQNNLPVERQKIFGRAAAILETD